MARADDRARAFGDEAKIGTEDEVEIDMRRRASEKFIGLVIFDCDQLILIPCAPRRSYKITMRSGRNRPKRIQRDQFQIS